MKSILFLLLLFTSFTGTLVSAQTVSFDNVKFFEDTSVLNVTIKTDMVKVFRQKEKTGAKFPANFSVQFENGSQINEPIVLEIRGHFRKNFCYIPPLKVIFKNKKTSVLKPLGALKLVNQCKTPEMYQQYLVSEFLVYKMFNLLTDKSLRVRLLNLKLIDSTGRKKTIDENAFLMENEKRFAKRNNFTVLKTDKVKYNLTDRRQMTLVDLFEYMIGNTDWGVSVGHNVQLFHSKNDSFALTYVVPYDFDYSGFVNTDYSSPAPNLNISSVRERIYRGFPRSLNEINEALAIFKKQQENMYALINNCNLLTSKTKRSLTGYLDGFFEIIKKPDDVKRIFVENARSD
ncbi:MAG: hypothetical protein ABI267_07650 [Ginsengibacter sp.]